MLNSSYTPENGKPLRVMHYGVEETKQKLDYFGNKTLISNEPLMATLVLYLSNVGQGGEILFPKSEVSEKSCELFLSLLGF